VGLIAPWAAVAIAALSLLWLIFVIAVFARRPREGSSFSTAERVLVALTVALALLWTALAPPWNLGATPRAKAAAAAGNAGSCTFVRDGMNEQRVEEVMRGNPRIVSEEDVRGTGASAWVYDEQRCIVHFINGKVIAIEQE
jgi:FlaG/FlaF family flagellin (archaellin)